jgi:hypothetical protein
VGELRGNIFGDSIGEASGFGGLGLSGTGTVGHRGGLGACYRQALVRRPDIAGRISFRVMPERITFVLAP